ncbi:hypothetical protein ACFC3F_09200 [Microbacterium sp. NPDC055910]|uniref:hypothetical protein n=1 Tax=Microbacterium sp. NPDC055910 TaxID=3345659 RepID=UPI0035DFF588
MSAREEDDSVLQARIAQLEAENRRLIEADAARSAPGPRRGRSWRAFLSAMCIVLAGLLVPVSIVGGWVRAELVDSDRFVATFGPLAEDPAVQAMLVAEISGVIDDHVDVAQLTDDLFDGVATLDLPPRALAALELLRVPAAAGARGIVDSTVTRVVESETFADVWRTALGASHRALVIAATGGADGGPVTIDGAGVIGIQLGPIIGEVKAQLIDRGVTFASVIPQVDRTIVVAQSDALVTLRLVYGLAVTAGWWLPVIALALFAVGVLVARRRTTAILGVGVASAFGGATLAVALGVGQLALELAPLEAGVSTDALLAIYEQVIAAMRQTAVVVAVVGIAAATLAWSQGRWRAATSLRRLVAAVNASVRQVLAQRSIGSGAFGAWMDRRRVLVRTIIGAGAVLWLAALRPLGIGDIVVVIVVALVAWWFCELARRPGTPEIDDPLAA